MPKSVHTVVGRGLINIVDYAQAHRLLCLTKDTNRGVHFASEITSMNIEYWNLENYYIFYIARRTGLCI